MNNSFQSQMNIKQNQKQDFQQECLNDNLEKEKLMKEIKDLKQIVAQKDQALVQWMRICEDLSQNLLQKQIDIKQLEISQNLNCDDQEESKNNSVDEQHLAIKQDILEKKGQQNSFFQNENQKIFNRKLNEDSKEYYSRYNGQESTEVGSCNTLNLNSKEQNSFNQQSSSNRESKKVECSSDSKQNENTYQLSQNSNKEQTKFSDNQIISINNNYIQEIEQIEKDAHQLLIEFQKQMYPEDSQLQQFDEQQDLICNESDIFSQCIKLKQCLEEMKLEKEQLTQQNNQFFKIINEKCLEIQHLQSMLIQRDQNVIDYSEKRNEEYRKFLQANHSLVNKNKEQREMIFRFQQQLALLNYLKAENQEVNLLKLEKQNLLDENEKLKNHIKHQKSIILEQSEYKLFYNQLKTDYDILANHIQQLGDEYISNSTANNTCPTCFSQDQYRLVILQLQQKYDHLEKKYKQDVQNLMEDLSNLKFAYENKQRR
ncbi:hypothetical protein ABPG72_002278 [Tetrahymena utriculariae]